MAGRGGGRGGVEVRTGAGEIDRVACRAAFAEGVRWFAREFGRTLAALLAGVAVGLFLAWAFWLLWFATGTGVAVLVSPAFIAGAELVVIGALWAARRLISRPS